MFTGIIETTGIIREVVSTGSNKDFWVEANIASELKPDQSVAHNGVCLTVVALAGATYKVTAVAETLSKTNLRDWQPGTVVNMERALKIGDRLDGHFVQGHVDTTGICIQKQVLEGSWLFQFEFPQQFAALMIEKGSVCINGVSLTAFNITHHSFMVTVIPYTLEHTNFQDLKEGDTVNLEFDVLGKYLLRSRELAKM